MNHTLFLTLLSYSIYTGITVALDLPILNASLLVDISQNERKLKRRGDKTHAVNVTGQLVRIGPLYHYGQKDTQTE